ncbi:unnamed protein product [Phaedon cochleariae]|uniref:Transmembrane protein 256 homolog n=1 Tax=Phaedon cochleariae TaxID=80249 RepID=A0A9N9X4T6_PHACE|nr:unnamed protein product [Phaedon cochleariae]
MKMGFYDAINYVVYDNPVSKSAISMVTGKKSSIPPIPSVTVITEKTPLWKLATEGGPFIRIAGVMGASAVILGAYGAHKAYPKDKVQELKQIYETANRFHFFHSLALLGVPMCKNPKVTGSLFITGTILFSGACYYRAFTGNDKLGRLAPIGGTILILGWLSMFQRSLKFVMTLGPILQELFLKWSTLTTKEHILLNYIAFYVIDKSEIDLYAPVIQGFGYWNNIQDTEGACGFHENPLEFKFDHDEEKRLFQLILFIDNLIDNILVRPALCEEIKKFRDSQKNKVVSSMFCSGQGDNF